MRSASSSSRGTTSCKAGSARTALAVCPVIRHSTDIDMLVKSFDQIASLIFGAGGDAIAALLEGGPQAFDPLAGAVVAFADQQHVAVG